MLESDSMSRSSWSDDLMTRTREGKYFDLTNDEVNKEARRRVAFLEREMTATESEEGADLKILSLLEPLVVCSIS